MEHSAEPIRLEVKSEKEILREKISKLKLQVKGLGATVASLVAVLAINSDLGKKLTGSAEEYKEIQYQTLDDIKDENKESSFSYTFQDADGLLKDVDKTVLLGGFSDEQMDTLKMIIEKDEEYKEYLQNLNTNPDGGTMSSGYVDESKPTN